MNPCASFRDLTLPAAEFTHARHVELGWRYLEAHGLAGALAAFPADLRRFAASVGATAKYHETLTLAWLLILQDRRAGHEGESWEAFSHRNPDLLAEGRAVIARHYTEACLASEEARHHFRMPDRLPD